MEPTEKESLQEAAPEVDPKVNSEAEEPTKVSQNSSKGYLFLIFD